VAQCEPLERRAAERVDRGVGDPGAVAEGEQPPHHRGGEPLVVALRQQPEVGDREQPRADVARGEAEHLVVETGSQEAVLVVVGEVGEVVVEVDRLAGAAGFGDRVVPPRQRGAQVFGKRDERRQR
jgi:hypothetical protein